MPMKEEAGRLLKVVPLGDAGPSRADACPCGSAMAGCLGPRARFWGVGTAPGPPFDDSSSGFLWACCLGFNAPGGCPMCHRPSARVALLVTKIMVCVCVFFKELCLQGSVYSNRGSSRRRTWGGC